MGWLVRKATLHWNSLGSFKLVDYMVAWLSLGYVNSGVFRFRLGCWSPGSCLYLTPARSLVNQRTDWISFFLLPLPAAFFVPALFFLLSKPFGLRTVGRQGRAFWTLLWGPGTFFFSFSFLITWMCPTDFPHCEVITSFIQVLQSLYYPG